MRTGRQRSLWIMARSRSSVLYYNPVIMLDRKPGLLDWIEDLLFTGLLFVAATLLTYEVLGWTLER